MARLWPPNLRGRVASLRGGQEAAIGFYNTAIPQYAALEMPLYEAATQLRLGELLASESGNGRGAHRAMDSCESEQIKIRRRSCGWPCRGTDAVPDQ